MLEPQSGEQRGFVDEMSRDELLAYQSIIEKPEEEWTRLEHRFVEAMFDRYPRL
jgi:predicted KAP-like P-loop ATPase